MSGVQVLDLAGRLQRLAAEAVTELARARGLSLAGRRADAAVIQGAAPEAFPGHRDLLVALHAVRAWGSAKATVTAALVEDAGDHDEDDVIGHAQYAEGRAWDALVTVLFELARKANR